MNDSQAIQGRSPVPFVVGTGRSGTTLVRMMLDAHSALAIPPETNFGPALEAFEVDGPAAAVEAIVAAEQWGDYNLSAEDLRHRVEERAAEELGDVLRAFYELYAERNGKRRWGDKSPYYLLVMRRVQLYLPEVRFVHVIRDGRDVALSTIPLWFGPDSVEEAAHGWVRQIEAARRQASQLSFYMEIRYEDLVNDPAATLRGICEFIDLGWEEEMLEYHHRALQRLAAETVDLNGPDRVIEKGERLAIHRMVGSPPQQSRVGRWRDEMDRDDRRLFESVAGDLLETLGYSLSPAYGAQVP